MRGGGTALRLQTLQQPARRKSPVRMSSLVGSGHRTVNRHIWSAARKRGRGEDLPLHREGSGGLGRRQKGSRRVLARRPLWPRYSRRPAGAPGELPERRLWLLRDHQHHIRPRRGRGAGLRGAGRRPSRLPGARSRGLPPNRDRIGPSPGRAEACRQPTGFLKITALVWLRRGLQTFSLSIQTELIVVSSNGWHINDNG
jgi:hypothetical protein